MSSKTNSSAKTKILDEAALAKDLRAKAGQMIKEAERLEKSCA